MLLFLLLLFIVFKMLPSVGSRIAYFFQISLMEPLKNWTPKRNHNQIIKFLTIPIPNNGLEMTF